MTYEEENKCPLCAEEMDWTDQQLNPCKCGYEVCVWCWHHIMDMAEKESTEGRCPACQTPYDKDRVVGLETNFQRVASISSSRKPKVTKANPKQNEGRKDLSNVRVIQRKMAYIIGLPVDYAYEELLERKEYFGQYGKVTKVSLSRTEGGTLQQFTNDACSVYVTFSKEEEAVRCIQSVHGYDLDGMILRASFGIAKYCHAWLRNTSCNSPGCLYLHSMGADEDSFGKDEVAVHTRNRVQEIVGATKYPPRRCGNMLPPPIIEQSYSYSASADDPVRYDGQKSVASSDHLPCSKDKDAAVRPSKETTTFVDIVGRLSNSVEEERMLNLSHDDDTESSGSVLSKNSEISDDQKSKDSAELSHTASFISAESKDPADTTKDCSFNCWWRTGYHNQSSNVDKEDNVQAAFVNSELNDGYNEKKFQSLAKSDRIYRGSNEEIVEHLRRLDNDTSVDDDDESSAAIENTIISNILSMESDSESSVYPQKVTGLLEPRDGRQGNVQNNEHSRFSFAKEHGFTSQKIDLVSPRNIGQGLNISAVQDSFENKDNRYKSQHQASRAQSLTPPGPPPGFSGCMRTDPAVAQGSGSTEYRLLEHLLRINKHRWLNWLSLHRQIMMRIELLKEGIEMGEIRLQDLLLCQQQRALDCLIRLLCFTEKEMLLLQEETQKCYAAYLEVSREYK